MICQKFSGALIWIKVEDWTDPLLKCCMSGERAHDLAELCTDLERTGNDFPTVWHTVLKGNALVDGSPHSQLDGTRPILEIRLITGEWLVFDGDAKNFSVK